MPIEFQCLQCQNRLRTPDDSAGKKSRCPQCGYIQIIPPLASTGLGDRELKPLPREDRSGESPFAIPTQNENPFADTPPGPNPYDAPNSSSYSMSNPTPAHPNATVVPGVCLIVTAAITIVLLAFSILAGIVAVIEEGVHDDDVIAFVFLGVTLAMQLLILWSGINMVRRRGYVMAIVGVIVAIAPLSACWCLNLPLGAWALMTLTKSGARAEFSPNQIL